MFNEKILDITKSLYPKGRAYRTVVGGVKDKLHTALNESENEALVDAISTQNGLLPDNPDFTLYIS